MAILLDGTQYYPTGVVNKVLSPTQKKSTQYYIPKATYTVKDNTPLIVNAPGTPKGLGSEIDLGQMMYGAYAANNYQSYSAPPPPPSPPTNYGGGSSYQAPSAPSAPAPPPLTWSETYQLANAPTWWRGMTASQLTPETEFATIMNTLIPYLSTEDQRQFASSLSRLFPDAFGGYSPEKTNLGDPTSTITDEQQKYFLSQKRAQDILGAMDKMKAATGKSDKDFGPGYEYVRQLAATMNDFGAREGYSQPTRAQQIKLYSAFDPMIAETQGEKLGAYGEVARSLAQPFFGAGSLIPVSKDQSGKWTFGETNKKWY